MKKWRHTAWIFLLIFLPMAGWSADEPSGVKPDTAALYRTAREQVDKIGATQAAKYAPETVSQAQKSLSEAQAALENGNDEATRSGAERAAMQVKLASALTEERISAEKLSAVKKELADLDQRLQKILAGKGEQP